MKEDDVELKNNGHENVRDSDYEHNDKTHKKVETNLIGPKVWEQIEVDVVSWDNEEDKVSVKKGLGYVLRGVVLGQWSVDIGCFWMWNIIN